MSIKSKLQALRSGVSFFGLVVAFSSQYYPAHAGAGTITVKDSAGATQTFDVVTDGSGNFVQKSVACDQSAAANCASVDASHNLGVVIGEALPGGTATLGVVNVLTITNPLPGGTNTLGAVSAIVGSLPGGTATLGTVNAAITGSLPGGTNTIGAMSAIIGSLPGGTATLGAVSSIVNALPGGSATLGAVTPGPITTWGLTPSGTPSSAPTNAQVGGVVYNSTQPTLTTGQAMALQSDNRGNLFVNIASGNFTLAGSTTNVTQWAGTTLGAISNYGTSPGAVEVPAFNAFVTNALPGGTNTIGAVSAIVGSLPGGTNTIGAVAPSTISTWGLAPVGAGTAPTNMAVGGVVYTSTQPTLTTGQSLALQSDNRGNLNVNVAAGSFTLAGSTTNITQWASGTLGAVSAFGTTPGAVNVPGVNAYVINTNANGQSSVAGSSPIVLDSTVEVGQNAVAGTNVLQQGVVYASTPPTLTTGHAGLLQSSARGGVLLGSQYPAGAIPIAATGLGTTGVVTGTLAGLTLATTFLCTLSVRSNANAAATGTVVVTGPTTALSYAHWTGVNSLGIGVTEMIYSPCLPASAAGAVITIASPAPGTGGIVSVDATGYQL